MTIFKGRNAVVYSYGRYGYTRGNGKVWHGGIDVVGQDDKNVRALRSGKVIRSRIVTDHSNLTWEWGNYVTILTDSGEQDIYAHLNTRLVSVGQTVKAGDIIGIMGNTGNAAGGYEHTHYERRASDGKTALDPTSICGCKNEVGVYTEGEVSVNKYTAKVLVSGLRVRPYPVADDGNCNESMFTLVKGNTYDLVQTRDGWAFIKLDGEKGGGWACISEGENQYLEIKEG